MKPQQSILREIGKNNLNPKVPHVFEGKNLVPKDRVAQEKNDVVNETILEDNSKVDLLGHDALQQNLENSNNDKVLSTSNKVEKKKKKKKNDS